jgi:hypothetical protein
MSNQSTQPDSNKSDDQLVVLALIFSIVLSPVGVVMGHIAINRINKGLIREAKRGQAVLSLFIGYIGTAIYAYGAYLLFILIQFFITMYSRMN